MVLGPQSKSESGFLVILGNNHQRPADSRQKIADSYTYTHIDVVLAKYAILMLDTVHNVLIS